MGVGGWLEGRGAFGLGFRDGEVGGEQVMGRRA